MREGGTSRRRRGGRLGVYAGGRESVVGGEEGDDAVDQGVDAGGGG